MGCGAVAGGAGEGHEATGAPIRTREAVERNRARGAAMGACDVVEHDGARGAVMGACDLVEHDGARGRQTRRRWVALPCCAALLALLIVPVAVASTLADVVPRNGGTVAGQPYRYWMTRTWELYFTAPAARPCQTITVAGKRVTLVENFHQGTSSCTVPAGSAIYVNEYTTHCSTIPGDHNGFGTTNNDLETCSRGVDGSTTKVKISVWLDKRNVPKFGNYFWRGTLAFTVTLAPNRFPGIAERQITAAAWGWSLLLRRLPKGTHTVHCRVLYPDRALKAQSLITLHVR